MVHGKVLLLLVQNNQMDTLNLDIRPSHSSNVKSVSEWQSM